MAMPTSLIDLDRYPVHDPDGPRAAALREAGAEAMRARSLLTLPGFVHAEGVARLLAEIDGLADEAERRRYTRTPYSFMTEDDSLPTGHPRRRHQDYALSMLYAHQFGAASPLRRLFEWGPLTEFLSGVIARPLYRSVDPTYSLMVTLIPPGGEHGWHFDSNDFVASLLLRPAEEGGVFEYVPGLRSAADESYDEVARVLDGSRSRVCPVPAAAGTLILFHGHHALHRVTRVGGGVSRGIALLSYVHDVAQTFDHARLRGEAAAG